MTTYAAGIEAGRKAIEILSAQFDDAQMYALSVANILPVHVTGKTDYEYGCSQAWADWQARRRLANRQARRSA